MLKANLAVMLRTGFEQAVLDAGQRFDRLGGGFDLGEKPRKRAFTGPRGCLIQNIAEGQRAEVIFHSGTLPDSLSLFYWRNQRVAELASWQQFGNSCPPLPCCYLSEARAPEYGWLWRSGVFEWASAP